MAAQKNSRRRGAILTITGYQKLQAAREKAERTANVVDRYTREELSRLTGLSLMTISKIFGSETSAAEEQLIPVDTQTLSLCFAAFDLELERSDYFYPDALTEPIYKRLDPSDFAASASPNDKVTLAERLWEQNEEPQRANVDWGEAPDVSIFYGRVGELTRLSQWVKDDFCKLVVILGMGGIGKTTLVTKLVAQLQPNFTKIVWRSLRNAPPLTNLLPEIIQIYSHQTETVPSTMDISAQISRLLHYLRQERCLLVLDNVEAIIQSQSTADSYHHEYPGYTELFRRIGESAHQSCLLLTSREKPEVIIPLEGKELSVRTLTIPGLAAADSESLFDAKGLSASAAGRGKLCETYSGNPLALNIVATSIYDLFDGDIDGFLELETGIFTGISQLLDYQFDRLSPAEQIVMYWLAIERDWISATDLHTQIVPATTLPRLLTTLESLGRKSLIERSRGKFTQQAVVMEYITERIVDRVSIELADRNFRVESSARLQLPLWLSHPLMKAQSPADLRTAQKQLILAPIASQLRLQFGNSIALERHIQAVLVGLHDRYTDLPQYGGGNIINLLRHLKLDLTDYNFANLFVWQADLQGATLHNVNFSGADLSKSVFTDTFGWISAVAFSLDSQILVTGEVNGDLCSWQMDTKQLFAKFIGHRGWIFAISFSPDGRILASASHDMTVRIWDVATGEVIHILSMDYSPLSLSFHPNGQILVTSHFDGTIKFWNVLTGKIIDTHTAHSQAIFALTFNPNGRLLATGSDDRTVKIWDVSQRVSEKSGESPLSCLPFRVGEPEDRKSVV